jgi:hypothetical protein
MLQGETCIDIRAVYMTGAASFSTTPAYSPLLDGRALPATSTFTKTVCL